jgi:hypothetical protein
MSIDDNAYLLANVGFRECCELASIVIILECDVDDPVMQCIARIAHQIVRAGAIDSAAGQKRMEGPVATGVKHTACLARWWILCGSSNANEHGAIFTGKLGHFIAGKQRMAYRFRQNQ